MPRGNGLRQDHQVNAGSAGSARLKRPSNSAAPRHSSAARSGPTPAATARYPAAQTRVAEDGVQDALDAAAQFRQALAKIGGQKVSVAPLSGNIAADIFEIQGEAAQAFADDLRARVKLEVLDGVVKGKTPKEIAADLVSKRIFTPNRASGDPSARGALAQVEKLARTEIRQVFNAASFSSGRA